jgi:hypothetical protein
VELPTGQQYVALSYVWGHNSQGYPSRDSDILSEQCPAVIEDAIQATLRLNQRFLWVDRYCIDQSNAQEKHDQIANMDSIYSYANLTIVAAAGNGMASGLPGVDATMRKPQPRLRIGQETVISTLPTSSYEINRAEWSTRGWTFQEALLSRRRVVFMEHQVYFQCNAMHCLESIHLPSSGFNLAKVVRDDTRLFHEEEFFVPSFPYVGEAHMPASFPDRVNEYLLRTLSYDSDILNAFKGILKAFEKAHTPVHHFWGLPLFIKSTMDWNTRFALGLAWTANVQPSVRRHGFPSWCWVGWKGLRCLSFPYFHHGLLATPVTID